MTTPQPLAAPQVQLADPAVADLQLALDGVRLPWPDLGGSADGTAVGTEPAGGEATDVELAVPAQAAAEGRAPAALVLTDREQTPVALLTGLRGHDVSTTGPEAGRQVVAGRVEPLRERESRLFRDLALRPADLDRPAGRRRAVVVGRPLLTADVAALATAAAPDAPDAPDDETLLLVPVENPTPDGMPPVTLMRSVLHVLEQLAPGCRVVAVPLHWRDAGSDRALAAAVGAAYGAGETTLLSGGADWTALLAALRTGDPLPAVADAAVLAEMLRWRPPPAERGAMILFTGLSGSGKSTLARDLAAHIVERTPRSVSLLDGDDVRRLLSSGLGFDHAARDLNVRRIGYVGSEIARHGGLAICAPIAPYAESRAAVRAMVEPVGDFVLVHVSTPLAECERRDLKGLYARARAGLITEFTGISDPYDEPTDADLAVDTSQMSREDALDRVLELMHSRGWIAEDTQERDKP